MVEGATEVAAVAVVRQRIGRRRSGGGRGGGAKRSATPRGALSCGRQCAGLWIEGGEELGRRLEAQCRASAQRLRAAADVRHRGVMVGVVGRVRLC